MAFDAERFRDLYPFTGHVLDRGGLRYHYLDEGGGEPVVCVHGNPTWSFHFRHLVEHFRGSRRVIAPDHIGCGLSDKPQEYGYTLKQHIDNAQTLVEHLDLRNIVLGLHDWGGAIGMGYAVRHFESVKRLVIMNTAAFHLPKEKALPPALRFARDSKLGAFLVRGFNAFAVGASRVATKNGMTREVRRAYAAPYDSWRNRIATLRFVQDIPLRPEDASYSLIEEMERGLPRFSSTPALICWGEKDFVFDRHFLERWKSYLPNAEVHTFPRAGHYVLEDASDEIIPRVRTFLEAHPLEEAAS